MKELTNEEKAKAYDGNYKVYTELINRLEDVKEAIKKQNYGIAMDILCKPYPEFQITTSTELAESEDEMIRENIIATIHLYYGEPLEDEAKEMIAWLEKQGEQSKKHDVCNNCEQQGSCVSPCPMKLVEKQGEQKPADTVEPKFKVGDWIQPKDPVLGEPRIIERIYPTWGYDTNKGILDFEYEDNWELAEEHKKCMYSKDDYTDEDRKVLCDGCEEECRYAQKEESVGKRFTFKAIPRLLEMIEPTDRAKVYVTKLADALEVEGYSTDAKIVMESLKIMNGEKVPMATMDEEPVSEEFEEAINTIKLLTSNTALLTFEYGFRKGAEWQKKQMMAMAKIAKMETK